MEKPDFKEIVTELEQISQNLQDNARIGESRIVVAFARMISVMGWSSDQQDTNNIQTANLIEEVKKLNQITSESNVQSQNLEKSNYRLQWVMLFLTGITTLIAIVPLSKKFFQWIAPFVSTALKIQPLPETLVNILSTAIAVLAVVLGISAIKKKISKDIVLKDNIKIVDKVIVTVVDKDGKIKN